jgi:hypothetical protein
MIEMWGRAVVVSGCNETQFKSNENMFGFWLVFGWFLIDFLFVPIPSKMNQLEFNLCCWSNITFNSKKNSSRGYLGHTNLEFSFSLTSWLTQLTVPSQCLQFSCLSGMESIERRMHPGYSADNCGTGWNHQN